MWFLSTTCFRSPSHRFDFQQWAQSDVAIGSSDDNKILCYHILYIFVNNILQYIFIKLVKLNFQLTHFHKCFEASFTYAYVEILTKYIRYICPLTVCCAKSYTFKIPFVYSATFNANISTRSLCFAPLFFFYFFYIKVQITICRI